MSDPTVTDTQCVDITPVQVEPVGPAVNITASADGLTATLTDGAMGATAARAYISWGDRQRDISTNPVADFASGISHTYARARSYNVRITIIDTHHERWDYTLTVTVP